MFTYDEELFSDLHKDAYGFRPRGSDFYIVSSSEKQKIWDQTLAVLDATLQYEADMKADAVSNFEKSIQANLDLGAPTREDAIRWIVNSLELTEIDLMYGGEKVCYELGLPYNMGHLFDPAINELMEKCDV